ncbi:QRFP-like peptide receptor [Lingula anatina]|uniref:QRFP-like peptide receptor n=1 Tax=Lingula anatina TaxID=7574 RepID=A0A1S3K1U4_LINAN|nr:QRFP-like peptide receptor [Lingula anatina]|eukprot:XP_013416497.1 QRFP-like peptide receptor [Lingula anatina]
MENSSALSTNNTRLLSTPFEVGFLNYSSQLNETCSKLDNATTPENPLYVLIYVSIFYSVIFLCGVAGNGLVLFVLWRNKDMRNSTNLLLANLSIADLFVLLVCMPTAIAEFYCKEVWYLGEAMCKLIPFLETVVIHASMLSILVISVERYYAICKPLHADQRCTTRKTGKILVGIWICAISVTTPFFAIAKERDAWLGDTPVKVCSTSIDEYWKKIYIVTVNVVLYATPGLLLIIIYAMICRSLMADRKNVVVGTCRPRGERVDTL